jgi:phage N-6-adenine-methyltransferase
VEAGAAVRPHHYASIFPALDDARIAELADDIQAHGQREAVLVYDGQILDGRNRWRACEMRGIACRTEDAGVSSDEQALALVMSLNLHRRHLTESQRAMAAARSLPMYEEAALARKAAAGARSAPGRTAEKDVVDLPHLFPSASRSRDAAALAANVSPSLVQHAKAVLTRAEPQVVDAVDRGVLPVYAASEAARLEPEQQREVVRLVTSGEVKSGAEAIREAVKRPHVTHNSGENEWYTPPEFIEAARAVLGRIDLDPASCEVANAVVGAACYYTREQDGLAHEWRGNLWMNPPYEKGLVDKFAEKMASEREAGRVEAACILVNNATDTRWFARMASVSSAMCFPTGRIRFLSPAGEKGAPLQGQAVIYIGDRPDAFVGAFRRLGIVVVVR